MARTVKDSKLDSRNARDKLKPRARPYFKQLISGQLHLGYRRRGTGRGAQGTWLVRRYVGRDEGGAGRYRETALGLADDFRDADGNTILNYAQAQARALESSDKAEGRDEAPSGPWSVAVAIQHYLTAIEQKGQPTNDTRLRADLHILPQLGSELIDNLTTERLRRWLADMAKLPARVRQKIDDATPRYKLTSGEGGETKRARRATANRVLTIAKAALNLAFDEGHAKSNVAWGRRLKPFRNVDVARTDYLANDEARRLINASEPLEFKLLVQGGLLTGARYSELAALTVANFNPDSSTIKILESKSGRSRHVFVTDEGARFFKQLCAGRAGNEVLFRKPDGTAWGKSEQSRPMAAAVARAKVNPAITFHSLRHTYASLSVMADVPLHVVSKNLGHSDTRMVEKHYGHLAQSYMKEAIRSGAPRFGLAKNSKVIPLARGE